MLSESRIDYAHIAALGGLRGRKRDVPADVNAFWQNQRFHNYADYAMSEDFHSGLIRLRKLGYAKQCAIMCAEAVWWRCHRRIIADYLIAAGETVFYILGRNDGCSQDRAGWHVDLFSRGGQVMSELIECESILGQLIETALPISTTNDKGQS